MLVLLPRSFKTQWYYGVLTDRSPRVVRVLLTSYARRKIVRAPVFTDLVPAFTRYKVLGSIVRPVTSSLTQIPTRILFTELSRYVSSECGRALFVFYLTPRVLACATVVKSYSGVVGYLNLRNTVLCLCESVELDTEKVECFTRMLSS